MGRKPSIPEADEYPQLREVANPTLLAKGITPSLGAPFRTGGLRIGKCKIKRVYYKPGPEGNCRLHFRVRIEDPERGEAGEQTFFAQLWPKAVIEERYALAQARKLRVPEFGEPVVLIPEWNMILWAYPNDPRLLGLADLSDPETVLGLIQENPTAFGLPTFRRPQSIRGQITKYVPSQRCGSLFELKLDDGAETGHVVYGKAYRKVAGPRAFDIAQKIYASEPAQRGDLILPEPFSYDSERHIFWQGALEGRPLAKAGAGDCLPDISEEVGHRLAFFHAAEIDLPVRRTLDSQLRDLTKSVEAITSTFPEFEERVGALHRRLVEHVTTLGAEPRTPVHGSFKFSHVFLNKGRVAFIDFDGATLGDPTYDVGRFIAHVTEMKTSLKMPPELADDAIARFVSGYNDNAATPLEGERIRWYASSLVLSSQVYKAVKRFDPGLIGKLLDQAEALSD